MSDELKPCPFCGGKPRVRTPESTDGYATHVACRCGVSLFGDKLHFASEYDAIAAWNTRATQPPAVGVDVSEEITDLRAEVEVLRRAVHTGISVIVESCSPRGNPDIDDASEIAAALHDMRAVLPDPLADLEAQP